MNNPKFISTKLFGMILSANFHRVMKQIRFRRYSSQDWFISSVYLPSTLRLRDNPVILSFNLYLPFSTLSILYRNYFTSTFKNFLHTFGSFLQGLIWKLLKGFFKTSTFEYFQKNVHGFLQYMDTCTEISSGILL